MNARVSVHVDTLVLETCEGDRDRIVESMRAELRALVAAAADRPRALDVSAVRADLPAVAEGPSDLGRALAKVIWAQCIDARRSEGSS